MLGIQKENTSGHLSNSVWLEKKENCKFTASSTRRSRYLTRLSVLMLISKPNPQAILRGSIVVVVP